MAAAGQLWDNHAVAPAAPPEVEQELSAALRRLASGKTAALVPLR